MKINRSLKILIILFLYKFLFDFSIITFIQKHYSYVGGIIDFNLLKFLVSNVCLVIIFIIMPKKSEKPSSIFLQIHLFVMIIPLLSLYGMQNKPSSFFAMIVLMFCLQVLIIRSSKRFSIVRIKHSKHLSLMIIVGLSIFVYLSMLRANGLPSLSTFNFLNVYDVRWNVKYPFLMNYLVHWQAKVINPFLIMISYSNKNSKLFVVAITLQILLYLITSHKSFILIPAAIIIIIKVLDKYDFFKIASYLSVFGILVSLLIWKIFDLTMIPFIIIYRLLFLPAQIKYYYYDFFSVNNFIYFSEGVIGKIFRLNYPYELSTANMISSIYYNMPYSEANTGYLADAYANGGFMAIFIMTVLLTSIFIFIDSLTVNLNKNVVVGLSVFSVLGLNDLGLLTTLLTGGMLLMLLLLYLENVHITVDD